MRRTLESQRPVAAGFQAWRWPVVDLQQGEDVAKLGLRRMKQLVDDGLEQPLEVAPLAASMLGQHTDEVLREVLGFDADRIRSLAEAGALGIRYGAKSPIASSPSNSKEST